MTRCYGVLATIERCLDDLLVGRAISAIFLGGIVEFTDAEIKRDFSCPVCGRGPEGWEQRAPDDTLVKCPEGHDIGKTVGQLRPLVHRIGLQQVQKVLRPR